MSKIILEQTWHEVREDATPTTHTYAEAIESDYVVIDGVGVDMRGAVGDFSVTDSDCYDGGWRLSRDGDVTTLHIVHTLATGEALPAHKVEVFETFPAYMLKPIAVTLPDGTVAPATPQTITSSYSGQITEAFVKAAKVKNWSDRLLATTCNYFAHNHSLQWARELGHPTDVFATISADGKARFNNFRDHSRLLGFARRVIKKYEDSEYGDYAVPATALLTEPAAIEEFLVKVENEFAMRKDYHHWFLKHEPIGLRLVYDAKILILTGKKAEKSESVALIPTVADYNDLLDELNNIITED